MTDRFLMCAPHHFEVAYVINPWMEGNIARSRNDAAMAQWNALSALIGKVAQVETIKHVEGVPDLVFTANAGLVLGNVFVPSRFRHPERQKEEPLFIDWFERRGFGVSNLPIGLSFEGAGDALFDRDSGMLWMGYGHRTDLACASLLQQMLNIEVEPLRLVNERFYHLDTCFCPLEGGYLMYHPAAFDAASQARIVAHVPIERRIVVADEDAFDFACNAVNSGRNIFLNRASDRLVNELHSRGFVVHQTALAEFMKAGGAAKCLTLKLNEERMPMAKVA